MAKMFCSNPECQWSKEEKGGRFLFSMVDKNWYCEECYQAPRMQDNCNSQFHFTTTHFNGKPIEVKGIRHLQKLEKEFGVSNHDLNYDRMDTPPPMRQRGNDMPRELRAVLEGRG